MCNNNKINIYSALFLVLILLSACGGGGAAPAGGGGTTSYSVGGTASGLVGSMVLKDNGADNLTVSANGAFVFATNVANGSAYSVTVLTQPTGQTCTVGSGSGTISSDVANVAVSCSNNSYSVGGSSSGLTGSVVLQDNGGDNLTVSANSTFIFASSITNGNTYSATVLIQPTGQTCSVSTGTGTISGSNVNNVAVVCSTNTYNVGGSVTGLIGTVVLQDNNGDKLTVLANGAFTFATKVANGSPYSVTFLTQPSGQSCSVASGTGTISLVNVTNVAVTCATNNYTIGGTVTGLNGSMVLQDNGGDNLTVATNGSFQFATAVAYSNTYSVTQFSLQYPNQTCTITNGSGTISANITTVAVNCVKNTIPRFAYVANYNSNNVSAYTINTSTGVLTSIGAAVAAGTGPQSVTVDPSGKFAYVANWVSSDVSAYTINSTTGALASVGPAVAAGGYCSSVTVDPTGKFTYMTTDGSDGVLAYTINASTGVLTQILCGGGAGCNGNVFLAGGGPFSVTVDPSGKFAYVANLNSSDVSAYTINAITGALTQILCGVGSICNGNNFLAGAGPHSVTVDPSGKFAYTANANSSDVSAYTINTSTGELIPILCGGGAGCNGNNFLAGSFPYSVTVDPTSKFAYTANEGSSDVSAYTINASTGALTQILCGGGAGCNGNNFLAGTGPYSVTIDPSGKFAYVANSGSANVSTYTINTSTGVLTSIGAAMATESGPYSVTTTGTIQ
jgi:6-phosphogluconolactonase (cycloisomerase 2 family)